MEKKNTLIFITAEYPYGKGETFIEAELKELAVHFDNIIIIPTEIGPDSNMGIRDYPSNCSIYIRRSHKKAKSIIHIFRWNFIKKLIPEMAYVKNNFCLKFRLIHLKIAIKSYLSALRIKDSIENAVGALKPEKLFLYSYWMGNGLLAAILAKRNLSEPDAVKVLSRAHGWDVYFERHNPPYLPWRKFMIENCDGVYCVSENGKKYFEKRFPDISTEIFKVEYLGVPASGSRCCMPDFFNNTLSVVSCSGLIKLKRVDLILDAILSLNFKNIRWTHIGDGPMLEQLKHQAAEALTQRPDISIDFTGYLPPEERDRVLGSGQFHLFINVSETEGLPVSIMEAMSFGIPVLATDVGGTAEIVTHGINGLLIDRDSAKKNIAESISDFHNLSYEKKVKLSEQAYKTWAEKFNSKTNYEHFAKMLNGSL